MSGDWRSGGGDPNNPQAVPPGQPGSGAGPINYTGPSTGQGVFPGASNIPVIGNFLAPKTVNPSASVAASNLDFNLANSLGQQFGGYQSRTAPQLGPGGSVGQPQLQVRGQPSAWQGQSTGAAGVAGGMAHGGSGGPGGAPGGAPGGPPGGSTGNGAQIDANGVLMPGLIAAANGTAPSAADISGQNAANRAASQQFGLASAMMGRSPGAALTQAQNGSAAILGQNASDIAANRANEQASARGLLAGTMGQQAGFNQQSNLANLDAQLKMTGMDDNMRQSILAAQLQAMGYGTGATNAITDASAKAADSQNKFNGGIVGGIASGLGL